MWYPKDSPQKHGNLYSKGSSGRMKTQLQAKSHQEVYFWRKCTQKRQALWNDRKPCWDTARKAATTSPVRTGSWPSCWLHFWPNSLLIFWGSSGKQPSYLVPCDTRQIWMSSRPRPGVFLWGFFVLFFFLRPRRVWNTSWKTSVPPSLASNK